MTMQSFVDSELDMSMVNEMIHLPLGQIKNNAAAGKAG